MPRLLLVALATTVLGAPARATDAPALVAVLPVESAQPLDRAGRVALDETLRSAAMQALAPRGFTVLAGETMLRVLEDNGVDAARACEGTCALENAREMKARLFVSATVTTSEGGIVAFVRLFETAAGRALADVQVEGVSLSEVRGRLARELPAAFTSGVERSVAAPRPQRFSAEGPVIRDAQTKLAWTSEATAPLAYEDAEEFCEDVGLLGGSWRLPTADEVLALPRSADEGPRVAGCVWTRSIGRPIHQRICVDRATGGSFSEPKKAVHASVCVRGAPGRR